MSTPTESCPDAENKQSTDSNAANGAGALVISQDLDEIFSLCDRIAVISQGRLSTPRPAAEITAEAVGLLMGASNHASGDVLANA